MNRDEKARKQLAEKIKTPEEILKERKDKLEEVEFQIGNIEGDINYKKLQLSEGTSREKHECYIDGVKPLWCIERDIVQLNRMLRRLEEQEINLKKLMEG